MIVRSSVSIVTGLAVLLGVGLSSAAGRDWDRCPAVIPDLEERNGIPIDLLSAISLVESGRWNKEEKALMAWPWAVMAEGRGRYLPTKAAAIREVRQLQARGVRNIDVGCMQINLQYHPDAFDSLADAFEPRSNAAYAAQFLRRLYDRHQSWSKAVAYYHSGDRTFNYPYRKKVMAAWRERVRNPRQADRPSRATAPASSRVTERQVPPGLPVDDANSVVGGARSGEQEQATTVERVRSRHQQLKRMHEAGMRRLDAMSQRSRRQSEAFRRYMDSLRYQD